MPECPLARRWSTVSRSPNHRDDHSATGRGVSPVIGVVLMVAITVVLSAVIGTYVLDVGVRSGEPAPTASLVVDAEPAANLLRLEHRGGDGLDASRTRIVLVNGSSGSRLAWPAASRPVILSAGHAANLTLDADGGTGDETVDWDGDGTTEYVGDGADDVSGVRPGVTYTIQLVDTDSQRVFFETTVRA